MKYFLYHSVEEDAYTFISYEATKNTPMEDDAVLVAEIEAANWDEATRIKESFIDEYNKKLLVWKKISTVQQSPVDFVADFDLNSMYAHVIKISKLTGVNIELKILKNRK